MMRVREVAEVPVSGCEPAAPCLRRAFPARQRNLVLLRRAADVDSEVPAKAGLKPLAAWSPG